MDTYKGKKMLHAVNVFAGTHHLSIGQFKVDEKSIEMTAIEPLLETIDITDKTITIDAMGCQKAIAAMITEKKGNYILAVKDNQKALHEEIQSAFKSTPVSDIASALKKDHGRIE